MTAEVYESLWKLISVKTEWSWNGMYQGLYDKGTHIIRLDACMEYYGVSNSLFLETDASGGSLGASMLQIRDGMNCRWDEISDNKAFFPIAFSSKSLSSTEWWYSNVEWEALGILHGLQKFHHYCFTKEVYIITDHKPLVAMASKDVATLSQWLQYIMLCIHQYSMCLLYKPDLDL